MREIPGGAQYRTVEEHKILEMLIADGWWYEVAAGRRESAIREAGEALQRCVAAGLAFRDAPGGGRWFDPVEAADFLRRASLDGIELTWASRCVPAGRREALRHPPQSAPTRYAVALRRDFNLAGRRPGDLVRLRLPRPLEDGTLRDLSLDVFAPSGVEAQIVHAPDKLDILTRVPEAANVSVGFRAVFTADVGRPRSDSRLDPAEAELYTRPSEGLIRISPTVEALSQRLAGGESEPRAILRRFWTFMLDEFACGPIHYDAFDPARPLDWVLERRWYDCQTGSALLAALCRARGMPARLVTGYLLHFVPSIHTWAEVWIEGLGWSPLDLMSWDLSAGGRDPSWRDHYFGRLDHRMPVERPPRLFSGTGGVRLPPSWRMLARLTERGSEIAFEDAMSGAWIYRDHLEVECLEAPE
jgi:hypothetical protein